MAVTIRRAAIADLEICLDLLTRFFGEAGFDTVGAFRDNLVTFLNLPENAVFLAEDEDETVGVVTVTSDFGLEFGRCAELEDLYVLPDRRGEGIAGDLVEAACTWSQRIGCGAVHLMVDGDDQSARRLVGFYDERGFNTAPRTMMLRYLGNRRPVEES